MPIIYRKNKTTPLLSEEVDNNFYILSEEINKLKKEIDILQKQSNSQKQYTLDAICTIIEEKGEFCIIDRNNNKHTVTPSHFDQKSCILSIGGCKINLTTLINHDK